MSFFNFTNWKDYARNKIVKLLKSPNGANIAFVVLPVVGLRARVEILEPRGEVVVLRRTPIDEIRKTSNNIFVYPYFIQFIFTWQIPICITTT